MGLQDRSVDCKICRGPRVRLNIDTPLRRAEAKGLQCAALAEALTLVNELIPSIVPVHEKFVECTVQDDMISSLGLVKYATQNGLGGATFMYTR